VLGYISDYGRGGGCYRAIELMDRHFVVMMGMSGGGGVDQNF